jgi:hypothetical protein
MDYGPGVLSKKAGPRVFGKKKQQISKTKKERPAMVEKIHRVSMPPPRGPDLANGRCAFRAFFFLL